MKPATATPPKPRPGAAAPAKPRKRTVAKSTPPPAVVGRSTVTKKPLSLAQAAEQWEQCKREMDRLKPLLEEAAPVLLDYFARSGRSTYKDRIALTIGSSRLVLDQAAVREFLGPRLSEFQKRTEPAKSLTLLKK